VVSALEFAKLTNDQALTDALVKRYDRGGPKRTAEAGLRGSAT